MLSDPTRSPIRYDILASSSSLKRYWLPSAISEQASEETNAGLVIEIPNLHMISVYNV
jgi:hypothetical protein